MIITLTQEKIWEFIELEDNEFYVDKLRAKHKIAPESTTFHSAINRFTKEEKIKRIGRGLYRKVTKVEPVKWWEANESEVFDFRWPMGHGLNEYSEFGFEDLIEVNAGDIIILAGESNAGKTAFALNILGENLSRGCVLMGNEYTVQGAKPSPKFKRRMQRMEWVDWMNGDGQPKFDLLPVELNYEDHVVPGKINIMDWIALPDKFWQIRDVLHDIQKINGGGVSVACLQKGKGQELAEGGKYTEQFASVYLTFDRMGSDDFRLTVGKVKAPKGRVLGRMWGFELVNHGANLYNIREIKKCTKCWDNFTKKEKCEECYGKGYTDKPSKREIQF